MPPNRSRAGPATGPRSAAVAHRAPGASVTFAASGPNIGSGPTGGRPAAAGSRPITLAYLPISPYRMPDSSSQSASESACFSASSAADRAGSLSRRASARLYRAALRYGFRFSARSK